MTSFLFKTIIGLFLLCTHIQKTYAFYYTVPTGNVAVEYKFGDIQSHVTLPGGVNLFNPLTTVFELVQVQSQKDEVLDINCVSKDKQSVLFPSITVWNMMDQKDVIKILRTFQKKDQGIPYDTSLIYDPVINYVKETCSEYTGEQLRSDNYKDLNEMIKLYLEQFQIKRPELNGESTGLVILKVFVEIPKLSDEVEKNYQEIAIQKTAKQSEEYRQETELKKKETSNKIDELEANKRLSVSSIENKINVEKNEASSKISKITAESDAEQKRIQADADSYVNHKKSEDNKNLLTEPYLLQLQLESYGCQNIIHYGNLPNFLPNLIK